MGEDDDLLAEVVAATLARLSAQQSAEDELNRRRLLIWRWHNERGKSPSFISDTVRDALRDRELTPEQIRDLGVGYHSIAKIVRAPKPGNDESGPPPGEG